MENKDLNNIKSSLKERLASDLQEGLQFLKDSIKTGNIRYDQVLLEISRHGLLQKTAESKRIKFFELDAFHADIFKSGIKLINALEGADFRSPLAS